VRVELHQFVRIIAKPIARGHQRNNDRRTVLPTPKYASRKFPQICGKEIIFVAQVF